MNTLDQTARDYLSRLDQPIESAENLPRDAYTDQSFFELELERVFGRSWTYVEAAAALPAPGDVVPLMLGAMPIILVRQADRSVKAFHNVCRHRGPILVREAAKAQTSLVCPYHAWAYDINGELKRTPAYMGSGRQDCGPLDKSSMGLSEIRCSIWHDGVFINLSGDAPPLADVYAPLDARWSEYDFSLLRYGGSGQRTINANWKLAMENFQEGYHLPTTHPFLNSLSSLANHFCLVEPTFQGQGSHHYDRQLAGHQDLPTFPKLSERWRDRAEYPAMLPNLMLGLHADHLLFFSVTPLSPSCTLENFRFYFVGDSAMDPGNEPLRRRVMANMNSINEEDIGVVESMQQGRHSPGYVRGPFSPSQEASVHQFQLSIARLIAAGA